MSERDTLTTLQQISYRLRSEGHDISAMSAEDNNNAQIAARTMLACADELDALLSHLPSARCIWCGENHDEKECRNDPAHRDIPTDYWLNLK